MILAYRQFWDVGSLRSDSSHSRTQAVSRGRWGPPSGSCLSALRQAANGTCGFCFGVDQVAEFRSGTPAREGRSASSVAAPTVVTEVRLRKTNRSISIGVVFSEPVGLLPGTGGRDLSTMMENLIDQAESAVSEVWPPWGSGGRGVSSRPKSSESVLAIG